MSDDFDIDNILGVMEEAAAAEKNADYTITTIVEREEIVATIADSKEFVDRACFDEFVHHSEYNESLRNCDLIVFECRLLEGLKDLKTIRQIRSLRPQIPLIVITANEDSEFVASTIEEGATDCIPATVECQVLTAKLNSFLKISKIMGMFEFKNEEVVNTMRSLRKVNNAMRQEKINRIVAETERDFAEEAAEFNRQMKEILDNLREGFFYVDNQLLVGNSTSQACEDIFGDVLANKKLGSILNFKNPEIEKHLCLALEQIFDDFMPEEVSVSLLPRVVETADHKFVDFNYTVVRDNDGKIKKVIIAASDISESVLEKQEIERKFSENRAIIDILKHIDSFREYVESFRTEISVLRQEENLAVSKRILHTLKGNSLTFELYDLGETIHHLETKLSKDPEYDFKSDLDTVENMLKGFLEHHFDLLKVEYIGQQQRYYSMSEEEFHTLVELGKGLPASARQSWEVLMHQLHCKEIGEICSNFLPTVERLAEKLEKKIDFKIFGDHFKVDAERFYPLMKNLIHVINNACDHGIEMPIDRLNRGKEETGLVTLRFMLENSGDLHILLSDDGAGIDWRLLIDRAREKGFENDLERLQIKEDNAYEILFLDGFSTADEVSETSGRGVGMASLKNEVQALGGQIIIKSKIGLGTQTKISIPSNTVLKAS